MVSIDKEHFLFQKYIEIFYSMNKKVNLLKKFQFLCILHSVLIRKSAPNKNKFGNSQTTANYFVILRDN
jgi:hypothetical protein